MERFASGETGEYDSGTIPVFVFFRENLP